jgi:hypothetical protein
MMDLKDEKLYEWTNKQKDEQIYRYMDRHTDGK